MQGGYDCNKVDLLAFIPLADMGISNINSDIWGWHDQANNREYAIVCGHAAAAFVDVTDTNNILSVAIMPSSTGRGSTWCSSKTYNDFALIVRDGNNGHGIQSFALSRLEELRAVANSTGQIQVVEEDGWYDDLGSIHNMVVTVETGFGYAVGSSTCGGGYHVVDLHSLPAMICTRCLSAF